MRSSWQKRRLGDLLQIQNGFAFDSKAFSSIEGMPLIRIRDLKHGSRTETHFVGDYDKRYLVRAGDLLIGMDGEFGCYEWKGGLALLNQRVCRLQSFTSDLLPRFLLFGVNSYLKAIEEVTGYATVKHLASKQILDIDFPVPPLPEQQRIVGILDEAFDGIATTKANAERNLQNGRTLYESHLEGVFSHRGDGWVATRLGDLATTQYGLSEPMNEEGKGFRIFRMGEVQGGRLIDTGRMKFADIETAEFEKYRLQPGDVLFNRTNSFELVGKTGIFDLPGDYCFASYLVRVVVDRKVVLPEFMNYFMNTECFQASVKQKASKSINQANINATILSNESVRFPESLEEQNSIVMRLNRLREETRRLESIYTRKPEVLGALKNSLLHQAFTGQL